MRDKVELDNFNILAQKNNNFFILVSTYFLCLK